MVRGPHERPGPTARWQRLLWHDPGTLGAAVGPLARSPPGTGRSHPTPADRDRVRALHAEAGLPFLEVFVDTPIELCEQRDPKGLYKKARAGEIKGAFASVSTLFLEVLNEGVADFTGISAPYEAPENPEIHIKTDECDVTEAVRRITAYLSEKGFI